MSYMIYYIFFLCTHSYKNVHIVICSSIIVRYYLKSGEIYWRFLENSQELNVSSVLHAWCFLYRVHFPITLWCVVRRDSDTRFLRRILDRTKCMTDFLFAIWESFYVTCFVLQNATHLIIMLFYWSILVSLNYHGMVKVVYEKWPIDIWPQL